MSTCLVAFLLFQAYFRWFYSFNWYATLVAVFYCHGCGINFCLITLSTRKKNTPNIKKIHEITSAQKGQFSEIFDVLLKIRCIFPIVQKQAKNTVNKYIESPRIQRVLRYVSNYCHYLRLTGPSWNFVRKQN